MSGALDHTQAKIMRALLIFLGQATLPSDDGDWPAFTGHEPNAPDSVITIYNTTGLKDGRSMIDGEVEMHPGVQIRVRAPDEDGASTKINAIAQALDTEVKYAVVTIDGSVYTIYSVSRTSDPFSLGQETPNSSRYIFTLNVVASLRQTA